ncbi:MAG: endopeptidase La, partial [Clostridia bacterium]|nr:endopeptidase La [Clostridia bacterium]
YLDTCLEFPFGIKSSDSISVEEARRILNEDHDGLDKVKERILEFVAVKQFSPDVKNQIICLVGPPDVGKTSVAASIARALGRKYARVSLGGMHDEAEIRGHRKTYVGAMPGRIVTALINAKVENPVIVLDEIDKMSSNFRGDPTSALLEVLDPEQNKSFRDNFLEIPIDLSDTLFIATANSYDGIPAPLLDRMEIIELTTYTDSEKLSIAKNHLVPKQLKRNGISARMFKITDGGILALIKGYTRESGVRSLEREIASLIRKSAKKIAEGEAKSVRITEKNITDYLGKIKVLPENLEDENPIGVVNGLAYTQTGGDLLKVEVAVMPGSGKIELTGSLGEVMKESAKIAHSFVRTVTDKYGINPDFYKDKDIHIHFPEGAIPKDGPSAGVTMVTAIVSALGSIPVKRDVAMTGEITLRGRVLPIGGLKEKTLAAYRAGVTTVLIPEANMRDLDDIDTEARNHLKFIPCKNADECLGAALAAKN